MTAKKDLSTAVDLTREEIQNKITEFDNLLKEMDRKDKIKSIHDLLEGASFTEVENVELYLLKKAKIVKNGEISNPTAPRVSRANQETGGTAKNIRFDLKSEHLSDAVLAVLDTTTPKSKEEIFKALGIVEGVEKEVGAASFDSYKTKFNLTVFADLLDNGKVIKHGSRVDAKYTKA